MPLKLNKNEVKGISRNPREFNHELVCAKIRELIQALLDGESLGNDNMCRCSYFPLEDLIEMGMDGELFEGANSANPDELAVKLTGYLWSEIVRTYKKP